jgi:hypothetical protein
LKKAREVTEVDLPGLAKKKVREAENGRCVGGLRLLGWLLAGFVDWVKQDVWSEE